MVSFSGGRTSAMMTHILLDQLKGEDVIVCFANTGKEEEATLEFVNNCDKLWGGVVVWLEFNPDYKKSIVVGPLEEEAFEPYFKIVSFETASKDGEPFSALIKKRKFVPNVMARFCTQELKVRVIKKFMQSLGYKNWINVVGFRYDEPRRWRGKSGPVNKQTWENWFPLVEMRINKPDVLAFWKKMPFDLELKEYQGNCDVCFLKGQKKLKHIAREAPEKMDWWINEEKKTGATFSKRYSYENFRQRVINSPELFDNLDQLIDDPTAIDCFCNVD